MQSEIAPQKKEVREPQTRISLRGKTGPLQLTREIPDTSLDSVSQEFAAEVFLGEGEQIILDTPDGVEISTSNDLYVRLNRLLATLRHTKVETVGNAIKIDNTRLDDSKNNYIYPIVESNQTSLAAGQDVILNVNKAFLIELKHSGAPKVVLKTMLHIILQKPAIQFNRIPQLNEIISEVSNVYKSMYVDSEIGKLHCIVEEVLVQSVDLLLEKMTEQ